jgi:hypothetical protein
MNSSKFSQTESKRNKTRRLRLLAVLYPAKVSCQLWTNQLKSMKSNESSTASIFLLQFFEFNENETILDYRQITT